VSWRKEIETRQIEQQRQICEILVMLHKYDAIMNKVVSYIDDIDHKASGEHRQLLRMKLKQMGHLVELK